MSEDITIADRVQTPRGQYGRVYYFQGNIYQPLGIHGCDIGRVKGAIKRFVKKHRNMIKADRLSPDYLSLAQLCDMQEGYAE